MRPIITISLIFLIISGPAAWAQNPMNMLTKASASYTSGDYIKTIEQLRETLAIIWNETPLTVQNISFVKDEPTAYGMYQPRTGNVFDGVDPILLYCEPVGYTVVKSGKLYKFAISADFSVLTLQGQVLGGQANFGQWKMESRNFNSEFMMFFTFNLKGIEPGEYILRVTLKDQNSDKTTTFDQPFEIAE